MANKKQLVLVVESNAALSPYWHTIVSDYLEKLIRSFCGNEAMEAASPVVELALVQFNAHGSCSPCLIQRSGWTRNVEYFLQWLSAMHVSAGGFGDAAIAEGLAEVLTSEPEPAKSEPEPESYLSDAETVARSFPQCLVSLSVICPRQLPKLESIYKVGKSNPSAADYTIDIVKNPQYLVLISESFMKACADLSQSGMTISVDTSTVSSTAASTKNFQNVPTGSSAISKEAISLQDSSPLSTCQEVISSNDNWKDLKPGASVLRSSSLSIIARTLMPPPRMSQKAQKVLQSLLSKYVKLWEAYREATSPESLAADWPSTMLINRVIPQDELYKKKYVGKRELIFFLAKNQHETLVQVQVYNFCMVIRLPSQILLLTLPDETSYLLGMLFPLDMLVLEPQTLKHPQLPPTPPPTPSK